MSETVHSDSGGAKKYRIKKVQRPWGDDLEWREKGSLARSLGRMPQTLCAILPAQIRQDRHGIKRPPVTVASVARSVSERGMFYPLSGSVDPSGRPKTPSERARWIKEGSGREREREGKIKVGLRSSFPVRRPACR